MAMASTGGSTDREFSASDPQRLYSLSSFYVERESGNILKSSDRHIQSVLMILILADTTFCISVSYSYAKWIFWPWRRGDDHASEAYCVVRKFEFRTSTQKGISCLGQKQNTNNRGETITFWGLYKRQKLSNVNVSAKENSWRHTKSKITLYLMDKISISTALQVLLHDLMMRMKRIDRSFLSAKFCSCRKINRYRITSVSIAACVRSQAEKRGTVQFLLPPELSTKCYFWS